MRWLKPRLERHLMSRARLLTPGWAANAMSEPSIPHETGTQRAPKTKAERATRRLARTKRSGALPDPKDSQTAPRPKSATSDGDTTESANVDAIVAAEIGAATPFSATPTQKETAPSTGPSGLQKRSSFTARLPFSLSGAVWAEHMSYLLDRDGETINSRNEVALNLVISTRIGSSTKFAHAVVDGIARADLSDETRTEAFFREAYVRLGWGPLTVLVGKRLLDWGVTDGFSPTNALRRPDLRDPLRPEYRGLFVVQSKLLLGRHFYLEGVWAPLFEDPLQPAPTGADPATSLLFSSSRWFVAPPIPLEILPAEPLADGPESFQYGARLGLSLEAVDISLSYSFAYLPLAELTPVGPAQLRAQYHRRHLIGADMQTTIGLLAIKAEVGVSLTEDLHNNKADIPDSFITYALQLELAAFELGRSGHQLRIQGLFYGDHRLDGKELATGLLHPFRFLAIGLVEWQYQQHTGVVASVLYEISKGVGARVELYHELVDGLRVELAGLFLSGGDDSFFGIFRRNHRVLGRMKYAF
jgi:hypothetical protein